MENKEQATIISRDDYNNKSFEIENKKINIQSEIFILNDGMQMANDMEVNSRNWITLSNKSMENQLEIILNDYKTRTNLIDTLLNKIIENEINGVVIDFNEVQEKESIKRFIIEITPKFREVGVTTCIVLNDTIEKKDYINIVDYIVE